MSDDFDFVALRHFCRLVQVNPDTRRMILNYQGEGYLPCDHATYSNGKLTLGLLRRES
jgi:hypothetical protein